MKISEVIQLIKDHHYKEWNGNVIKPETTRDKVLYGDVDKECTGVVTTIYASVDVIRKAAKAGANLIVECRLLMVMASPAVEHGLSSCAARA